MTDYIDRQAAIDAIKKLRLPRTKGERPSEGINRFVWSCAIDCAEEKIGHLPSIEPVKHGRWETEVRTVLGAKVPFFACSVCGSNADDEYAYCPKCGAKMDEEEAETEHEQN